MHPLQVILEERNLSPYDLKVSGVSARTFYNIIQYKHKPNKATRELIAQTLGVSEYELFESEENMRSQVYKTTLDVLKEDVLTRNNTKLLVAEVYKRLCGCTDLIEISSLENAPSIESIARCRRFIVEDFPELKGNEDVEYTRIENTKKYIDFNNYGIMED